MDCIKIGKTISKLRKEKGLKQRELAEKLNISDKTISKWECGLGCPDVSLLNELANILNTKVENILDGNLEECDNKNGNMKNIKVYMCTKCNNIITALGKTNVNCCGRKLENIEPIKACQNEKLQIDNVENEWLITSNHEMKKDNYISFVMIVTGDKEFFNKCYPEWNLQIRIPNFGHGKIIYGTSKGKILYQYI